jgi:glutathione S-transferase
MSAPLLILGNKNYSSWSLRPYMAMAMAGIKFEDKVIPFNQPMGNPEFKKKINRYSKAGQVPVLVHNDITVWDTMSIMEYLAETWPDRILWPKNKAARALARSACAEMHAGFRNLRGACPMNLRRPQKPVPMNDAILKDVARIETLWRQCRKTYGKGGPFFF